MDKLTRKEEAKTASIPLVAKTLEVSIRQRIFNIAQAQQLFKKIFETNKITYKDSMKNKVVIECERLLNHLQGGKGGITRARYLPLLEDIITNPQVILKDARPEYPNRYYYFSKYKLANKAQNIAVLGDGR